MPPKRLKSRNWIRENNKNYDAISYIWNVFFFFFFQLALINIFFNNVRYHLSSIPNFT